MFSEDETRCFFFVFPSMELASDPKEQIHTYANYSSPVVKLHASM